MKKKSAFVLGCILTICLVFAGSGSVQTASGQPAITKDSVLKKSKDVQAKYDIVDAQWYDMYEKGIVTGAGDAAKLIKDAGQAISTQDFQAADSLLTKADVLLSTYTKADLPSGWMVPNPLAADPSIMGNIHKASLEELKKVELYGSPRFNTWFQFSGKGDDGNLYGLYACVNHHGTGKAQKRVMFAISSNVWKDKPNQLEVLDFMVIPERKDNKDNLIWEAKDGDRYFKWTITKKDTTVYYKDAKRTVNLTLKTDYSFWYNRGIQPVELLPGGQTTGFEQPGKATGTMTLEGKTIKVSGHGEFENYFVKGAGYREVLLKYGNEWWVAFTADQLSGIFFTGIAYRDAGLYIDGKYVIPKEFHITPIEAKKSYTITAKTSLGDLNLKFNFWGNNPALYEYWGTMEGTLAGKPLTNGFAWIEHVPRGGVDLTQPTSRK
jgi:hypothetical protein